MIRWRALESDVRLQPISYRDRLVALATPRRVLLTAEVEALEPGSPLLQMVALLCLYARDIQKGLLSRPYDQREADRYARLVLIPDERSRNSRNCRTRRSPDASASQSARSWRSAVIVCSEEVAISPPVAQLAPDPQGARRPYGRGCSRPARRGTMGRRRRG